MLCYVSEPVIGVNGVAMKGIQARTLDVLSALFGD